MWAWFPSCESVRAWYLCGCARDFRCVCTRAILVLYLLSVCVYARDSRSLSVRACVCVCVFSLRGGVVGEGSGSGRYGYEVRRAGGGIGAGFPSVCLLFFLSVRSYLLHTRQYHHHHNLLTSRFHLHLPSPPHPNHHLVNPLSLLRHSHSSHTLLHPCIIHTPSYHSDTTLTHTYHSFRHHPLTHIFCPQLALKHSLM